jgi:hypothetical protein
MRKKTNGMVENNGISILIPPKILVISNRGNICGLVFVLAFFLCWI